MKKGPVFVKASETDLFKEKGRKKREQTKKKSKKRKNRGNRATKKKRVF